MIALKIDVKEIKEPEEIKEQEIDLPF